MTARPPANDVRALQDRWWLAAILFLSIRTVTAIVDYRSMQADPDAYRALAEGWAASGTFGRVTHEGLVTPTAYRPPLYPWLLSWFVRENGLWLPGVAMVHLFLGALTSLLTWDIARRLTQTRSKRSSAFAWLAGLIVALDPILLRQSSLLMTETAATFLAVLIWWTWVRAIRDDHAIGRLSALGIGALMGLSCLLRSSSMVWCPILICMVLIDRIRSSKSEGRARLLGGNELVILAVMLLVLVPWAVRNRVVLGSTIWTTTHGGYTLLLANNPVLYEHFEVNGGTRTWDEERFHQRWSERNSGDPRQWQYWDAVNLDAKSTSPIDELKVDEVTDDRLANQSAWATIGRSPIRFAKASAIRIGWFWAFWPASEQASLPLRIAIGGWYALIFILFAYGCICGVLSWWFRRFDGSTAYRWLPAISLVIGLTSVHAVYWSNMRMRAPLIPIVAIVAAWAIVSLGTRDRNRL